MFVGESLRMAGASLWSHKLRSVLTVLGVVIGITSVLAVVTVGQSLEKSIVAGFNTVDDRTLFVTCNLDTSGVGEGPPDCQGLGRIFSNRDAAYVRSLPSVSSVIAQAQLPIEGLRIDGRFVSFPALSTAPPNSDVVSRLAGGYHSGDVFRAGEPEVVLSYDVAERLGGGVGTGELLPLGKTFEVIGYNNLTDNVTVVGILSKEDNPFVQFTTNTIFAPIDRYYTIPLQESPVTGDNVLLFEGLAVVSRTPQELDEAKAATRAYFESPESDAYHFRVSGTEVYVASASDITEAIGTVLDQVTLFISAIAIVSLVVGAIGIANIMLVSVTERTREIGVMKAIGARDGEVLVLFLLEATLIGLVGAVIGVALGLGAGVAIIKLVPGFEDFIVAIPYDWVGIALAVGILTGILAGFMPARRATKIQPIQALAYE
jgi:putative ABC transport system permease protein